MTYYEWSRSVWDMMKQYPLIKNKWKESRFKKMYKDGLTAKEAFRCWICAH